MAEGPVPQARIQAFYGEAYQAMIQAGTAPNVGGRQPQAYTNWMATWSNFDIQVQRAQQGDRNDRNELITFESEPVQRAYGLMLAAGLAVPMADPPDAILQQAHAIVQAAHAAFAHYQQGINAGNPPNRGYWANRPGHNGAPPAGFQPVAANIVAAMNLPNDYYFAPSFTTNRISIKRNVPGHQTFVYHL
eukprot:TRINITY_DN24871_c0_g1_i1.p2 TRINITY_DN24871_c0_g1~~TRINITY_DN24871_c0_g1_i1.p2  ORF type:complete len:190 (-),score=21.74 TRINITY_DN24871_c0_g1_i1:50-619(-)